VGWPLMVQRDRLCVVEVGDGGRERVGAGCRLGDGGAFRVGERGRVVSVEIDAELADAARAALERRGCPVSVVIGDGVAGFLPAAPYDRTVATAAVYRHVPYAWVEQTRPGGLIVTPWGTAYHNGSLLRLRVSGERTADGRFRGILAFMRLRTQRGPTWGDDENLDDAETTTTALSSGEVGQAVAGFDSAFAVGVHVPDCRVHVEEDLAGEAPAVWLCDGYSLARVVVTAGGSAHRVDQRGPRRLWDEVEAAFAWWRNAGEPKHSRFGMTVRPDEQVLWLDDPANPVSAL